MLVHRKLAGVRAAVLTAHVALRDRASHRLGGSSARAWARRAGARARIEPAPIEDVERREARALLAEIIDELDEPRRCVYVLHEIEEVPMKEIAESLGWPLPTAYKRLYAARRHVTDAIERLVAAKAGAS